MFPDISSEISLRVDPSVNAGNESPWAKLNRVKSNLTFVTLWDFDIDRPLPNGSLILFHFSLCVEFFFV